MGDGPRQPIVHGRHAGALVRSARRDHDRHLATGGGERRRSAAIRLMGQVLPTEDPSKATG
jgi:phosphohistidine phosphatase SixA